MADRNFLERLLALGRQQNYSPWLANQAGNLTPLPSYEQPGGSLPFEYYLPRSPDVTVQATPPTMPATTVKAAPASAGQVYGPPNWLALGDQSRTAAYDPIRDANDPRNIKAVDETGRANALASIDDLIKRLIAQGVISG